MKEKLCEYCGEEKGQIEIPNPNSNSIDFWKVCITCKKVIEQQQKLSFGLILEDFERKHKIKTKLPAKLVNESKKELSKLSYESGKEILSVFINKMKPCVK